MRMRGLGSARPHQYTHVFSVLRRKNKVAPGGTVVKDREAETEEVIPDGILAEADEKAKEMWKQNQHPISHTIVSYHPVAKVREKDILILGGSERRFQVQGLDDPGGTGQFAIYYVLERRDVDGNKG